jgi:hypothetical protein
MRVMLPGKLCRWQVRRSKLHMTGGFNERGADALAVYRTCHGRAFVKRLCAERYEASAHHEVREGEEEEDGRPQDADCWKE